MEQENNEPKKDKAPKQKEKDLTVVLSYIGILCLVPLLARKDDPFAQFHAKQGLVLCVAEVATMFISWIPLFWVFVPIIWIAWLALSIIGIMNVLNDKKEPLPVIGKYADRFKI